MQLDITNFVSEVINEKQHFIQKGISNNAKKRYSNHVHMVWVAIVELCDKTQMEYFTLRAKITYPQDDG